WEALQPRSDWTVFAQNGLGRAPRFGFCAEETKLGLGCIGGISRQLAFFLKHAVAADVQEARAALEQDAADEAAAVAMGGVFLATEQGEARALCAVEETIEGSQEVGRLGDQVVADMALLVVKIRRWGAAAEGVAHE